jgi:hypothetical protein
MYKRYQKIIFGIGRDIVKTTEHNDPVPKEVVVTERPAATKKIIDHLPQFSDYMLTKVDYVWDMSVDNTAKVINFGLRPIKRTTKKVSETAFKFLPNRIQKIIS